MTFFFLFHLSKFENRIEDKKKKNRENKRDSSNYDLNTRVGAFMCIGKKMFYRSLIRKILPRLEKKLVYFTVIRR